MTSDIHMSNPAATRSDMQAVANALQASSPHGSTHREAFEESIALSTARSLAVAIASAEQALPTLLAAMGITHGREVILPALGETACLRAIRRIGATPRFADCDPGTLVPQAAMIEAVMTNETAAVIAAHGDGWGSGLPKIADACARREIPFIELVGTKIGSVCTGAPAGSLGRAAIIDLSARSIISGGEGAVIVTDDEYLAERCRGGDYTKCNNPHRADPMAELNAAFALSQAERLPSIIAHCTAAAEQYMVGLSSMPELLLPATTPDTQSNWSRYVVRLDETFSASDRDEIIRGMRRHDIAAGVGLIHLPSIWGTAIEGECPISASMATRTIALPIHADLTGRDIDLICQTLQLMVQRTTFRRAS
ncbi:MAG: DegT/DnrJ/EryC1/StrS family aminotransferase [Phycisphaerales bacterium]|nr:DegT/DnrJ/EryC1/StrS family aminotransferase [Phycisphaerales bacterium]